MPLILSLYICRLVSVIFSIQLIYYSTVCSLRHLHGSSRDVACVYHMRYTLRSYLMIASISDFIHMRHKFLISKGHSSLAQARTVLITNLPDDISSDRDLREFASFVPGGVERTWVYRDTRVTIDPILTLLIDDNIDHITI
jgi:calcium permeable stress-gated cation channel